MKILITTEWYTPTVNGVITSIINLKDILTKQGHEVRVLTLSDKDNVKICEEEGLYTMSSYGLGKIYPGARFALTMDDDVLSHILQWSPDIIHTQCEFSTFRIARRISEILNVPLVHTYHTVYEDYTHYFSPNKKWGKKAVGLFSKKVLNSSEAVIAPTKKVELLLKGYKVTQPIHVIPTGLDLVKFSKPMQPEEIKSFRNSLAIPDNCSVLVSVGRVAKEKNLEEIIYYMSRLQDPSLRLLVVGDGPYRSTLEEYVDKLNMHPYVIFVGMVDPVNIPAYYQLGDVFVSASTSETQGLSYIEALASGVLALCRKDDCLLDVIRNGENGYQYTSYEEFKSFLYTLLNQEQFNEIQKKEAQSKIEETYSIETFGKQVEAVYFEAIQNYTHQHVFSM
ncbi:glycosyltransferase family 4 protein [Marinilactibacillus psychrotolerans]|uniref:Glycosyltransferase family 4 protein n=1 Tax=Marinilactibacillus psychrotolerans TaxID=191770 RepID=A0A5R9C2C5_9LACT|nr:glycosyltransferase family 4 protein [Marinilactibacillus psychrotolerans]TLQ06880.1 glycosyltransferase family 4 protein [Marinilactibacillus psychrotolerans]